MVTELYHTLLFKITVNLSGSEPSAVTTSNEMTMTAESGGDIDTNDIPYETDESS